MTDGLTVTTVLTFAALTVLATLIYWKAHPKLAKADRYRLIRLLLTSVTSLTIAVAMGHPLAALGIPAHVTFDRFPGPDP